MSDRPEGELTAAVVVACDGVNSFLAEDAGLYLHPEAEHLTLGVKEVLALDRDEIDRRFGRRDREGADIEILGGTGGVAGGGFLYTNLDSVAVGRPVAGRRQLRHRLGRRRRRGGRGRMVALRTYG